MTPSDVKQFVSNFFGPSCPEEFIQAFASPDSGEGSVVSHPAEDTDAADVKERPILVCDVLPYKRNRNPVRSNRETKEVEASLPRPKRNHAALPFGRSGYNPSPIRKKDVR